MTVRRSMPRTLPRVAGLLAAGVCALGLGSATASAPDEAAGQAAFRQRCVKCHTLDEAVAEVRKRGDDAARLAAYLRRHHVRNDEQAQRIAAYLAARAARPG